MIGQLCQALQKQPEESQQGESEGAGRKQGRGCKRKPIAKRARKNVRESCGEESLKTIEPAPLQA